MSNPYESPQSPRPGPQGSYSAAAQEGDATGGVIPYKNMYALVGYYVSIFTLLCCITPLPLGLVPLVLGIKGLQARARNPVIKGSVHAWIAIVLGGISALGSCLVIVAIIVGLASQPRH